MLAAALLAASTEGAVPRALHGPVKTCASQSRVAYDGMLEAMRRGDALDLQRRARELRSRAQACATRVSSIRAAGLAACGRSVAVRGLRYYRDGAGTMDAAATASYDAWDRSWKAERALVEAEAALKRRP